MDTPSAESGTIFISHSSIDKPFAYRLAIDLLAQGFSVWLDRWELEAGDALESEINTGVDTANCVLLVVSPRSNSSHWVQAEMKRARQAERRRKQSIIVPLLLEGTELPEAVHGRIYLDFRDSYGQGLDRLVGVLRRRGLDQLSKDPARTLIPLSLTRGVDLNELAFEKRVTAMLERLPGGFSFTDDHFIVAPDGDYEALRTRVMGRRDELANDPNYSAEFQRDFLGRVDGIEKLERILITGVRRITNAYGSSRRYRFAEAAAWFARGVRARTLGLLYTSQARGDPNNSDYGREWIVGPGDNPEAAARFYGFQNAISVRLIGPKPAIQSGTGIPWHTIGMWIDGEGRIAKGIYDPYQIYRFPEIDYGDVAVKQAIPSMVYSFESSSLEGELWELDACRVSVS